VSKEIVDTPASRSRDRDRRQETQVFEQGIFSIFSRHSKNRGPNLDRSRPGQFTDEVARKTQWSPLRDSGSLRSRRLSQVNAHRCECPPTLEIKGVSLFFITGGIAAFFLLSREGFTFSTIVLSLGALAIISAGIAMMYLASAPIVFDKTTGLFWKGRRSPDLSIFMTDPQNLARLADIHAIQLISKLQTDNIGVFCELNLVMDNGRRIHVLDQRNADMIREYGKTLSRFLEKPFWDATR